MKDYYDLDNWEWPWSKPIFWPGGGWERPRDECFNLYRDDDPNGEHICISKPGPVEPSDCNGCENYISNSEYIRERLGRLNKNKKGLIIE